jgi:Fe2+ or Zn2+ uptake regulation protein
MARYVGIFPSAEALIMDALGNKPISKKNLLLKIEGIDQSTVYRVTKKLQEKGKIKIITEGQRTSYKLNYRFSSMHLQKL